MEPLAPAVLAGLTPPDVEVRFYDDRMDPIPYDEPTDLVAMSVETYTAKRAYQIASMYRQRGVPVVMGGFHTTLVPEEASEYAESIVVGEAEGLWPQVIDDFRHGRLRRVYQSPSRPPLCGLMPDRSIFAGKRYLPVGLVEAGRGCHLKCEFCAIQSYFGSTQAWRPTEEIVEEIRRIKKPLIFFVDVLYDCWWLHPDYRYGMVPFVPKGMTPEMVKQHCLEARSDRYSLPSIFKRSLDFQVNSNSLFMWSNFFVINRMIRREVLQRNDFPLGDEVYDGPLIKAAHAEPLDLRIFSNSIFSNSRGEASRNSGVEAKEPALRLASPLLEEVHDGV